MLKEILDIELKKTFIQGYATINLQRIVFKIVHNSLIDHYGQNYSIRCLQSSMAIQKVLNYFGINSLVISGSTCFPQISGTNPYIISWGGFWDKDHHIWVMTELRELIDLTISQLHIHPSVKNNNVQAIPPVWWHPIDYLPSIIEYFPEGKVNIELPEKDLHDLELFLKKVDQQVIEVIENNNIKNIGFSEIISNINSIDILIENKNHWAMGTLIASEEKVLKPEWIVNKRKEIMKKYNQD